MDSFDFTFLGHQGWLFTAGQSRLLVDPLLNTEFGHQSCIGVVHPPRVFTWDAFPPVDALFLSHEHEDHFNIPSLAAIDRRVPVLLSARSSRAAQTILGQMGFTVRRVEAGEEITIGDLRLHTFAPDLIAVEDNDEWDVLPFLVRDARGHGAFFSSVDVSVYDRLLESLRKVVDKPPAWCATNNTVDLSFTVAGKVVKIEEIDSAWLAMQTMKEHQALCFNWGEPPVFVLGGGGFAFVGDRAWMNDHAFPASSEEACGALRAVAPGRTFLALVPGQTVSLRDGALAGVRDEAPFLSCLPCAEWPRRAYVGEAPLMTDYAPFTEARPLDDAELAQLGRELDGWATTLTGGRLFRGLLALDRTELDGKRPTFCVVALTDGDGGSYVYEYDLGSTRFVRVEGRDPAADYVAGVECWATDLLAALRVEIGPAAVTFGRWRTWSALPERVTISGTHLWLYAHPLRRPEAFLRFYERMLAGAGEAQTCVRAVTAPR
jgi:hypothetical protein